MTALFVFVAQFVYIFLLGLQQLNVVGKHYVQAWVVSFVLGSLGYYLVATIAVHADQPIGSPVWWCYVLSGPFGICFAMWVHPKLIRRRR